MKLRIPQTINASTKDNQAFSQNNGELASTQYLPAANFLSVVYDSWSFFYIHSFIGIGQYCLTLITVRLGCSSQSLDKGQKTQSFFFFLIGRVFAFLFKMCHSTQKGPNRAILCYCCLVFSFLVIFATVHAVPPLMSSSSFC